MRAVLGCLTHFSSPWGFRFRYCSVIESSVLSIGLGLSYRGMSGFFLINSLERETSLAS